MHLGHPCDSAHLDFYEGENIAINAFHLRPHIPLFIHKVEGTNNSAYPYMYCTHLGMKIMGLKIPIPKSFQIPMWEYPILNNGSKFKPFQSKRDICEIPTLTLNSFQLLNIPIQQQKNL